MICIKKRQEIEQKVVRHLIRTMKARGWVVSRIDDGGDPDEDTLSPNEDEAMEAVFAVDECRIHFTKATVMKTRTHLVCVVLGNDGWDCIADYSYAEDDDFQQIMEDEVDPYCEKLEEEA